MDIMMNASSDCFTFTCLIFADNHPRRKKSPSAYAEGLYLFD